MGESTVTVWQIARYLDQLDWHPYRTVDEDGEKEGYVLTGWETQPGQPHELVIDPVVEKDVLIFQARSGITAPPDATATDRLSAVLTMIGHINGQLLLGAWCYDPMSGEVMFRMGIPTDDGLLSEATFRHCLQAVGLAVERDTAILGGILEGTTSLSMALEATSD